MGKCNFCGFHFIGKPEGYCVNCGFHFDFVEKYVKCNYYEMHALPYRIPVRTGLCSVCQPGEVRKGLHAHATLTNKAVEIVFFQKFEETVFVRKTWRFKENPKVIIPYRELSLKSTEHKGQTYSHYTYCSLAFGEFPLNFDAAGSISHKYNLNREMKKMCDRFIYAATAGKDDPKPAPKPEPPKPEPPKPEPPKPEPPKPEPPKPEPPKPAPEPAGKRENRCRFCGAELEAGDIYCIECGEKQ